MCFICTASCHASKANAGCRNLIPLPTARIRTCNDACKCVEHCKNTLNMCGAILSIPSSLRQLLKVKTSSIINSSICVAAAGLAKWQEKAREPVIWRWFYFQCSWRQLLWRFQKGGAANKVSWTACQSLSHLGKQLFTNSPKTGVHQRWTTPPKMGMFLNVPCVWAPKSGNFKLGFPEHFCLRLTKWGAPGKPRRAPHFLPQILHTRAPTAPI
jgi:hypothetical protein